MRTQQNFFLFSEEKKISKKAIKNILKIYSRHEDIVYFLLYNFNTIIIEWIKTI